jgi:hypothetical protein
MKFYRGGEGMFVAFTISLPDLGLPLKGERVYVAVAGVKPF